MKFMKILLLLAFLGTMLGSVEATAATATIRGVPAVPGGAAISGTVGVGAFTDYWTFNLGTASGVSGAVINNSMVFFGLTFQNISGLSFDLVSASLGSAVNNPLTYSPVSGDTNPSSTLLAFSSLAAGDYALRVTGNGVGILGGSYSGTLAASAITPVPEPETYVMLLVAFLLLGAQLHRKNLNQNSMLISA